MTAVVIPGLRLDVTPNARLHWATRARRVKLQRYVTSLAVASQRRALPALPVVCTITRCSPGTMDDDNAVASAKAVRDAVADVLGVDDCDPRVTWVVRQRRAPWGVQVEITPRTEEPTR
ncbi:MAG TPA: hypothetical protein VFV33_27595 [Gemmatimonadaceae bacterium]|nr:hypothetical protein [Gemmatimonadaceae bacterium]